MVEDLDMYANGVKLLGHVAEDAGIYMDATSVPLMKAGASTGFTRGALLCTGAWYQQTATLAGVDQPRVDIRVSSAYPRIRESWRPLTQCDLYAPPLGGSDHSCYEQGDSGSLIWTPGKDGGAYAVGIMHSVLQNLGLGVGTPAHVVAKSLGVTFGPEPEP
eukprot:m.68492 g.68492  ORF g.68492 m.68492 type:complete len:161 (+) comp18317_c0_seq2:1404-1886(+)